MGGTHYSVDNRTAILHLEPSLYHLEMVYATAYLFLDKIWVLFEGDPKKEIIVKLTPKDKTQDPGELAREFCNRIISITNYFNQLEKNKEIIQVVLQRALFSASPESAREAEQKAIDNLLKGVDCIAPSVHLDQGEKTR